MTTPTKEQFDLLVRTSKASGSDMFEDATPQILANWFKGFQVLTKKEADKLIEAIEKKESNWTASEKVEFNTLFKKMTSGFKKKKIEEWKT